MFGPHSRWFDLIDLTLPHRVRPWEIAPYDTIIYHPYSTNRMLASVVYRWFTRSGYRPIPCGILRAQVVESIIDWLSIIDLQLYDMVYRTLGIDISFVEISTKGYWIHIQAEIYFYLIMIHIILAIWNNRRDMKTPNGDCRVARMHTV